MIPWLGFVLMGLEELLFMSLKSYTYAVAFEIMYACVIQDIYIFNSYPYIIKSRSIGLID